MNTTAYVPVATAGMVGWEGTHPVGVRPSGIHPWALVGAPPETRAWTVGNPTVAPEIASDALVDAFCTVDAGTQRPTRIGERSWLQKRVHVGHDTQIGADCEIAVGVVLCGFVEVGDNARIGGNTWVKPRVKIGEGAIIGGGSVVTKDVPAHEVWAGNPARYMKPAWTHPHNQSRLDAAQAGVYPTPSQINEYLDLELGLGALLDGDHA